MIKKLLLASLLAFSLVSLPQVCMAEEMILVSKSDLIQLAENFQRQENNYNQVLNLLNSSEMNNSEIQKELNQVLISLENSKETINQLENSLAKANHSIEIVNQLLIDTSKELKSKNKRIKLQRNIWFVGCIGATIGLIAK